MNTIKLLKEYVDLDLSQSFEGGVVHIDLSIDIDLNDLIKYIPSSLFDSPSQDDFYDVPIN